MTDAVFDIAKPKATTPAPRQVARTPESVKRTLRSPGQSLSESTQKLLEPRFPFDLGKVRVHSDSQANRSADEINAKAYSFGNHVVLGNPSLANDVSVLSHELTHVGQTRGNGSVESAQISESMSRESEANRFAAGTSFAISSFSSPAIQRLPKDENEKKKEEGDKDNGFDLDNFLDILGVKWSDLGSIAMRGDEIVSKLVEGVNLGVKNFSANIGKHLKTGLISWLVGPLKQSNIKIPTEWDAKNLFKLILDILGLSYDYIREKLANRVGEKNVAAVEKTFTVLARIAKDGIGELWEFAKESFVTFKDEAIERIREFVMTRIIEQGIKKILLWLNPTGAVLQIAEGLYDFYQFLKTNVNRFQQLLDTIIEGLRALLDEKPAAIAGKVEEALGQAVTVLIDLFAKLTGLDGVQGKVKDTIKGVRAKVDKAIDQMIDKAVILFNNNSKANTKKTKKQEGVKNNGIAAIPKQANHRDKGRPWAWASSNRIYHKETSGYYHTAQAHFETHGEAKRGWTRINSKDQVPPGFRESLNDGRGEKNEALQKKEIELRENLHQPNPSVRSTVPRPQFSAGDTTYWHKLRRYIASNGGKKSEVTISNVGIFKRRVDLVWLNSRNELVLVEAKNQKSIAFGKKDKNGLYQIQKDEEIIKHASLNGKGLVKVKWELIGSTSPRLREELRRIKRENPLTFSYTFSSQLKGLSQE